MRTITAFVLAFVLAFIATGCYPSYTVTPAPPDFPTFTQYAPGATIKYTQPVITTDVDKQCKLTTYVKHFTLVTTGGYRDIDLTVDQPLDPGSSATIDGTHAMLVVSKAGASLCTHWRGLVAWVPGDASWRVEIKATCDDDGSSLDVFFEGQ